MRKSIIDPLLEFFDLTGRAMFSFELSKRWIVAFMYGLVCHVIFTVSVLSMILAMFWGMTQSFGKVPYPWSHIANLILLIQFPLAHSFLLSSNGKSYLLYFAPKEYSKILSSTTFALLASIQLFLLFCFWTPSNIIIWEPEGRTYILMCILYGSSWLLLIWASLDAGAELQSGALGWMSLAQNKTPKFPDMPTIGLFKYIRQPIYLAFALTTWTTPIWTLDQWLIASIFTFYCYFAPKFKEKRFEKRFGQKFVDYKSNVPYMVPGFKLKK